MINYFYHKFYIFIYYKWVLSIEIKRGNTSIQNIKAEEVTPHNQILIRDVKSKKDKREGDINLHRNLIGDTRR